MRIPSGNITSYVYFYAGDTGAGNEPEPGLDTFIAKYSRNGGTYTTMTTPTVNATDTGDGLYELLVDEGTTMDAGFRTQELILQVEDTGRHMRPARRVVELFRDHGDTGRLNVNVAELDGDTGFADMLGKFTSLLNATGQLDTGSFIGNMRASLDTGERVAAADALLDRADAIETGMTLRQAHRLATALLGGEVSGARTGTEVFRNAVADTKTRATVTVDSSGNRSAVSTDLT